MIANAKAFCADKTARTVFSLSNGNVRLQAYVPATDSTTPPTVLIAHCLRCPPSPPSINGKNFFLTHSINSGLPRVYYPGDASRKKILQT